MTTLQHRPTVEDILAYNKANYGEALPCEHTVEQYQLILDHLPNLLQRYLNDPTILRSTGFCFALSVELIAAGHKNASPRTYWVIPILFQRVIGATPDGIYFSTSQRHHFARTYLALPTNGATKP